MQSRIIEIVELGQPKSLIQRENEPITELIDTNLLIDELNQALSLFAVSGRSEQLKAFREWWNKDNEGVCTTITHKDIDRYLKSL